MWYERIRKIGFAFMGAAISLVAWKSVASNSLAGPRAEAAGPEPASHRVLTIPVEIVESGEAPRLLEIRVSR